MFSWGKSKSSPPRTPRGHRAYVVGDVHGRLDLLEQLLGLIDRDIQSRPVRKSLLVFLGDLIDRGPDSRGVVQRLMTYRHDHLRPYFLAGNHEEVLLRLIAGERGLLASWLQYGGAECLVSYGLDPQSLAGINERAALSSIKQVIPKEHVRFLTSFGDTLSFGDYLFVHAGIRPRVDLSLQSQSDLRWIRAPFLDDDGDHGMVVVHGHSIVPAVDNRANRIGIDTGAYRTGVLTSLGLEGAEQWILDTADDVVGTEAAMRDFDHIEG